MNSIIPPIDQDLVERYLAAGYIKHDTIAPGQGLLLLHQAFYAHKGEVRDTLPMALRYVALGHLVVLTPPVVREGRAIPSPDGILDQEWQTIEFKRCLGSGEENIYRNLSKSSKQGTTVIRAIWVDEKVSALAITKALTRKYRSSTRLDRVDVHWQDKICRFSRLLFFSEGEIGISKELLK